MDPLTETIGDVRFARRKRPARPLDGTPSGMLTLTLVITVAVTGFVGFSWLIVTLALDNQTGYVQVLSWSLVASLLIGWALIISVGLRLRRSLERSVEQYKRGCIAVVAAIRLAASEGSADVAPGHLQVNEGRLVFESEDFDFALRFTEFEQPDDVFDLWRKGKTAWLTSVSGLPRQGLKVRPAGNKRAEQWLRLKAQLDSAHARVSPESVRPPIRYAESTIASFRLLDWIPGSLVCGIAMAMFVYFLPEEVAWQGPGVIGSFIAGCGIVLVMPIMLWQTTRQHRAHNNNVDKLATAAKL